MFAYLELVEVLVKKSTASKLRKSVTLKYDVEITLMGLDFTAVGYNNVRSVVYDIFKVLI